MYKRILPAALAVATLAIPAAAQQFNYDNTALPGQNI